MKKKRIGIINQKKLMTFLSVFKKVRITRFSLKNTSLQKNVLKTTIPKFPNEVDKEYYLSDYIQKKAIKRDYLLTGAVSTFADMNSMIYD